MQSNKKPLISLQAICHHYEKIEVLCGINGSIHRGEVLGLIGPNGGGKTTLLRILAGLLQASAGKLSYLNQDLKVSYVPQQWAVDRSYPITVKELLLMGLIDQDPWGPIYKKQNLAKAEELCERFGIAQIVHKPIQELSGGQIQRALLARALIRQPDLLLLDEATSQIDPQSREIIYQHIMDGKKKRATVMVSHLLHESMELMDRIWCLQNTLEEFSPKDLCKHHALGVYHRPEATRHGGGNFQC